MRSPPAWWPIAASARPMSPAPASPTRFLGIPDNGLVTLTELADHVTAIREVFPGPADGRCRHRLRQRAQHAAHDPDAGARRRRRDPDRGPGVPQALRPFRGQGGHSGRRDGRQDQGRGGRAHRSRSADRRAHRRHRGRRIFNAAMDRAHAFREAGADVGFVEAPTERRADRRRSPGCRGRSSSTS